MSDSELIKIFKALANPHRLEIFLRALEYLPSEGEVVEEPAQALSCQREIAAELGIVPSTISHHFKELSNAGLINMRRNGQQLVFSLNQSGISKLKAFSEKLDQES